METRDGQVVYRGGVIPVALGLDDPTPRRAVGAVPGLGFVGVDFIWNEATGRATVLEINPRPTTSYVALARLLPSGSLARAWLAAVPRSESPDLGLADLNLSVRIHAQAPLTFHPNGTVSGPTETRSYA